MAIAHDGATEASHDAGRGHNIGAPVLARLLEERRLFEEGPIVILRWVLERGGTVEYVSPSVAQFGYAPVDFLSGRVQWSELIHPEDLARIREAHRHFDARTERHQESYRLRCTDGRFRWVDHQMLHVRSSMEAGPAKLLGYVMDTTDRRLLEARAMANERMAAVGTLASGVAHEVNNPLAAVIGNLQFVLDRVQAAAQQGNAAGDVAETEHAIADALQGAARVRDVVRALLSVANGDELQRSPVSVSRALDAALTLCRVEIEKRARLEQTMAATPLVLANERGLTRALANLLLNAAQAIPVGGQPGHHAVCVRVSTEGARAAIEVSDTGSGIRPEDLSRVFDPFFTTRPPGQGPGLGLSICRSIVESYGGEVTFSSTLGVGSTFCVLLPVAQ